MIEKDGMWKEEITKEDKVIMKVLHRLLGEEKSKIEECLKRIEKLNYQSEYFCKMFPTIQDNVKDEMFSLMHENRWDDWIKTLKEELKLNGENKK